jgi:hypothetical protein
MTTVALNTDAIQAQAAYLLTHAFSVEETNDSILFSPNFQPEQYAQLLKVQAFIVKVKHASIRRETPCTFRLLAKAGLELRFFASLAAGYLAARRNGPIPTLQHLTLLRQAFQRFGALGEPACPLIADMYEHEFALRTPLDTHPARLADGAFVFEGACVLACSRYDLPSIRNLDVGAALSVPGPRHYLLYQHAAGMPATRVLELDTLSAVVVQASSGTATSSAVAAKLCQASLGELSVDIIDAVFDALRERGIGTPRQELET